MNEFIVKKIFEKHAKDFKINFAKEVPVENGKIDYEIFSSGKRFAVEAKGTRSDEYSTIGQLLNAKRTYSHVYLLAPVGFLKKVWKILKATNTITDIGLMTVSSKKLYILKKPDPKSYYYNPPVETPKKSTKKRMFINEAEINLESILRSKIFTVSDIAKTLNISMAKAYHRLARLKAVGMVEEVLYGGNPKRYRFIKSRRLGEKIDL
ncbi:MAG: winged helix-turn-helix domain-containing protein [Candidatus Aenigmarchaeota archaeon]|nr:winged helix-turn-helix domain-containing protein [Candidatus Aenigmarchaeota archaeon]